MMARSTKFIRPAMVFIWMLLIQMGLSILFKFWSAQPWLISWFFCANVLTMIVYSWDKIAAIKGWQRHPEMSLLGLAFIGGSTVAVVIQFVLRHKIRKRLFHLSSWLIFIFHVALLIVFKNFS